MNKRNSVFNFYKTFTSFEGNERVIKIFFSKQKYHSIN